MRIVVLPTRDLLYKHRGFLNEFEKTPGGRVVLSIAVHYLITVVPTESVGLDRADMESSLNAESFIEYLFEMHANRDSEDYHDDLSRIVDRLFVDDALSVPLFAYLNELAAIIKSSLPTMLWANGNEFISGLFHHGWMDGDLLVGVEVSSYGSHYSDRYVAESMKL